VPTSPRGFHRQDSAPALATKIHGRSLIAESQEARRIAEAAIAKRVGWMQKWNYTTAQMVLSHEEAEAVCKLLSEQDELREALGAYSAAYPCPGFEIEPGMASGCDGSGGDCPTCATVAPPVEAATDEGER
jgi:hypothetical protein